MTIQEFLNDLNDDIYTCCRTKIEFRIIVSIILSIIIAFSLYGWLCTTQVIQNNMGFCNESLTFALCSEIALVVFFIIPMIVGCMLNCIYPVKSKSVPKTSRRIQEARRASYTSELPVVSVSPSISGSPKQSQIKVPPSPKTVIPDHAYSSFNKLHTIQEKRKSKSPTRRLSV